MSYPPDPQHYQRPHQQQSSSGAARSNNQNRNLPQQQQHQGQQQQAPRAIVRRTGPIQQQQQQQQQPPMVMNSQQQVYTAQQQNQQQQQQQHEDVMMQQLAERLLSSAGGQAKLREVLGFADHHQQQGQQQPHQHHQMNNNGSSNSRGASVVTVAGGYSSNRQQQQAIASQQQQQQLQHLIAQLQNQHQVDLETIGQMNNSQDELKQRLQQLDAEWKQKLVAVQRQATDVEATLRAENSKLKTHLRNAQDHDAQREQMFQLEREQLKGKLRQQLQEAQKLTQAQIDNALKMERNNQAFIAGQQMEELRTALAKVEAENRNLRQQNLQLQTVVQNNNSGSTSVGIKQEEAGAVDRFAPPTFNNSATLSSTTALGGGDVGASAFDQEDQQPFKKQRTEAILRAAPLPSVLKKPKTTSGGTGHDTFPVDPSNPSNPIRTIGVPSSGRSISREKMKNAGTSPLEKRGGPAVQLYQQSTGFSPQLTAELAATSRRAVAAKKRNGNSRSGAPAQQQPSNSNQQASTPGAPGTTLSSVGFNGGNSITMLSSGGKLTGGGVGGVGNQRSFTLNGAGAVAAPGQNSGNSKMPVPETTSSQPSPVPHNPLRGPDMERRFVFSGVDSATREKLQEQVITLGQRASLLDCPQDAPPPKKTTHVVIDDRPRNVKALCGIVSGMYVVTKEYIMESAEKGFWLDELDFGAFRFFPPPLRDKQVVVRVPDDAIRERIEDVVRFGEGIVVNEDAGEEVDSTMLIFHNGDDLLQYCDGVGSE